jgi:hypothetical protein
VVPARYARYRGRVRARPWTGLDARALSPSRTHAAGVRTGHGARAVSLTSGPARQPVNLYGAGYTTPRSHVRDLMPVKAARRSAARLTGGEGRNRCEADARGGRCERARAAAIGGGGARWWDPGAYRLDAAPRFGDARMRTARVRLHFRGVPGPFRARGAVGRWQEAEGQCAGRRRRQGARRGLGDADGPMRCSTAAREDLVRAWRSPRQPARQVTPRAGR